VTVLYGDQQGLAAGLEAAIARGSRGIISFGIAGGLASALMPGDWVVAVGVVTGRERFPTDRMWGQTLLNALPAAVHADIASVDTPVANPEAKHVLRNGTGAVAVDMESHIVARVAAAHGLPFTVCRVIIDPAQRTLPPAALINLRPDGTPNVPAVIRSMVARPSQLPALLRLMADARTARAALLHGRRLLGAGLGFPDGDRVACLDKGPPMSEHEFFAPYASSHLGNV
jgi:adenosylhomocysteine nucleosidase